MARYIVKVESGRQTASLLLVLSPSQLCSALLDTVKSRLPTVASQLELTTLSDLHITLHLNSERGPMLDIKDLLSDILPDAQGTIYAVVENKVTQANADLNSITPASKPLALSATLSELKSAVCQHLTVFTGDDPLRELDCNCSAARHIGANAAPNERVAGDLDALHTLVVVYADNKVAVIPVWEPTLASIQRAAGELLQEKTAGKLLSAVGGVEDHDARQGRSGRYLLLPILAVCSHQSHGGQKDKAVSDNDRPLTLDLHTSECPIDITAHNKDITLGEAGLDECAVNGVLTIFAVQRVYSTNKGEGSESVQVGKAAIFEEQCAWKHPLGQSSRGTANLLSTLRSFTHLTSGSNMEEDHQDAVLRILHLIFRFPPAVRTAYVLMRGETPQPSECAALSQCLYETLKHTIHLSTIQNRPRRFFEDSGLLFGLILSKAKNLRVSPSSSDASLPYLAMRVHDLRNAITMLPVRGIPVQSKAGIVDAGLYEAFSEDGVLNWTNGKDTGKAYSLDRELFRAATLAGGTRAKVVVFNPDAVAFAARYLDENIGSVIAQAEFTNLQHLATMCGNNQLSVVPPADLPSASPPVLTLDREGFLAVYVGREGCGGAPGRDILMFRPLVGEEAVDVSIITQLLVPILERRKTNGTAIFEAYGSHHRQIRDPDEAVVLCVNLSTSMNSRSGFIDIEESEDAEASLNRAVNRNSPSATISAIESPGGERLALDELKEYLLGHSSFEDMLAIVRAGIPKQGCLQNAHKVLNILGQLDQQQIAAKTDELEVLKQKTTSSPSELSALSNRLLRMERFADSLCAFLTHRAENAGSLPEPQSWRPGAAAPLFAGQQSAPYTGPKFQIPTEFLCPISSEIMEDPVMTVDNFTYERKNIERWFHNKKTSPLTNIALSSLDLRHDAQIKQKIDAYVQGTDVYAKHPATTVQTVSIKSPLESWSLELPSTLTLQDLYMLAFRLTKGRYMKFELRYKNARLPCSLEGLQPKISSLFHVFITPLETTPSPVNSSEMCLIKVYSSDEETPIFSYWESKTTTKTLASVVFRYYRHKFSIYPFPCVQSPFIIWHNLRDIGDGQYRGRYAGHWEALSKFFNQQNATGSVHAESMYDEPDTFRGRNSLPGRDPLVLKLNLGPTPNLRAEQHKTLSRLDVLKQMFDAFINRLLAYSFQTHVGLVTFGTTASVSQNITHAVENFRYQLNNMVAEGDTAIWDSIALASDQLQQFAARYPKAKLRIICISDGEDNKSTRLVHDLASELAHAKIVVDSFCISDTDNTALRTLSYMTGGYKFKPATLEEAMAICEMKPVLSQLERPIAALPRSSSRHARNALYRFEKAKKSLTVDHATRDEFPPRKALPQLSESFVELMNFTRNAPSQVRSDSNLRLSRIHTEMRNCAAFVHPYYDIYICEPNFGLWKIVMQGPPENYPMLPPKARFVTPMHHPNINRHGRICHSILDRNWTVDTTTKDLIDTIYSLLLVPEFSDPINTVVTLNYHWDEVQFKDEAQRHIQKHATKTRAEWRQ
ncbi:hypothetical protein EJ07DRAFT_168877 [Lizonia empirigonia]|nr:hypothetical protein EJ07DRAFT_168877 [Lizonia empirigonia]